MARVTDVDAARAAIQHEYGGYEDVPTYSRMLDLEGAAKVADIAMLGNETVLRHFLDRLEAMGVTDLMASLATIDDGSVERTTDFLTAQL